MIVREPMVPLLQHVDRLVQHFGCRIFILDAFRPWWVQVKLWRWLRNKVIADEGLDGNNLSVFDEVRIGMRADDVGSYCKPLENEEFADAKRALGFSDTYGEQAEEAAKKLEKTPDEIAYFYLAFRANAGLVNIPLDLNAITAHGNGGAVDVMLVDLDGRPVFMGATFDYLAVGGIQRTPAVMNYFDHPEVTVDEYADAVSRDPVLKNYCKFFGHTKITQKAFNKARKYRRLLMNAFLTIGATPFSLDDSVGEFWHFNLPNWGGNQCKDLPGSGNACHALLANVVSGETGKPMAVWSNSVGHKLAAESHNIRMPKDLFKPVKR
jgi:D-alanyl-D-alanine dipeptidase